MQKSICKATTLKAIIPSELYMLIALAHWLLERVRCKFSVSVCICNIILNSEI